ncbi:unnamed protein product [Effrenium voratum]|uniref:Uncharacterized protein n=1 Tax=Effrenium voratum TaxID=2562239 RepID=A0AA36NGY0_9DINO|nr:unnamed protein product [Effrenium voratum]
MAPQASDSAIEYLLKLQAKPRRRQVCCAGWPSAWPSREALTCCEPEKCACPEVVNCSELDASFSSQGSEPSPGPSPRGRPRQLVQEARIEVPRATPRIAATGARSHTPPPIRVSVVHSPVSRAQTQTMPMAVQRISVVQRSITPPSKAVHPMAKPPAVQPLAIAELSATRSHRQLPQAPDLSSPASSARSAPVLGESVSAVPVLRWSSAAALTGSQRGQVLTARSAGATGATCTPATTPRSSQVTMTPRTLTSTSYQPPLRPVVDSRRSQSWQPAAPAPSPVAMHSARYRRPPMAQVVA